MIVMTLAGNFIKERSEVLDDASHLHVNQWFAVFFLKKVIDSPCGVIN